MTLELLAIVIGVGSFLVAGSSLLLSVIVYRNTRRRELWWAVIQDDTAVVGKPISFRLYGYFGKAKPRKKRYSMSIVIRGYVVDESLIGREQMSINETWKHMHRRRRAGDPDPKVPDEAHPPRITMIPVKVIRHSRRPPKAM
ncbi:MAG: hypothetical protein OXH32_18105 [Acidobacteria bacterium]|nr:hypothetical protein [Acidobacteriota bacterium]